MNFLRAPSWEALKRVLLRHDVNGDGFGGYYLAENIRPTNLAARLGERGTDVVVTASGSLLQTAPALAGYAAGWWSRKKDPAAGYALMLSSTLHHLVNSLYPWQAVFLPEMGGDWVALARLTGVPPLAAAAAFTAILPLEAVALWGIERSRERAEDQRRALQSLARRGALSEEELRALYDAYPARDKLRLPEGVALASLASLLEPLGAQASGLEPGQLKELGRFLSYVIARRRSDIEAEIRRLPRASASLWSRIKGGLAAKFKADKVGAALDAAAMSAGVAAGAAALVSVAKVAWSAAAQGLLATLIPGLGIIGAVSSIREAARLLSDPSLGRTRKSLRVAQRAGAALLGLSVALPAMAPLGASGFVLLVGSMIEEWIYESLARRDGQG